MNNKTNSGKCIVLAVILLVAIGGRASADYTFGTPTEVGPGINTSGWESSFCLSADDLELYFTSSRTGEDDMYVATRATASDPWGAPVSLGSTVNSSAYDNCPAITADGLSLFFSSMRPGGRGDSDLYVTKRATVSDPWGAPVNLGPTVNSSSYDAEVSITDDGLSLFFGSTRSGGRGSTDIYVATRATTEDDWGSPVNLGSTVNSSVYDQHPRISGDGLLLFFGSKRAGSIGQWSDIWMTQRASVTDPWARPVNIGEPINTTDSEPGVDFSSDGLTIYFVTNKPGGAGNWDIWQVPIIPVIDLNGDGIVDAGDMAVIADHWHTDNSLCDIGPTPFGDGIVDVKDMIVLSEHFFEHIGQVAHWAFDETEGDIAYDSAGLNDAFLSGGATWQPGGGHVDGALEFDGVDGSVIAGPVLNPADGPLSVWAWVKGGAPGQAVISEPGGANWLATDPSGYLMTELTGLGRSASHLLSQTVITDGQWHRIGFVWDGSYKTLYVDGVVVAQDTQDNLGSSSNGLYIGAGKAMAPGTYWSGLIDDVRIYDRAVEP